MQPRVVAVQRLSLDGIVFFIPRQFGDFFPRFPVPFLLIKKSLYWKIALVACGTDRRWWWFLAIMIRFWDERFHAKGKASSWKLYASLIHRALGCTCVMLAGSPWSLTIGLFVWLRIPVLEVTQLSKMTLLHNAQPPLLACWEHSPRHLTSVVEDAELIGHEIIVLLSKKICCW